MPHVNYVWGGAYYAFYIGSRADGPKRLSEAERSFIRRLREEGAQVAIIANMDTAEMFLNMNARALEIRRLLPRSKLVSMLKEWGKGKLKNDPLEREILALKPEQRNAIYGVYVNGQTYNEVAEDNDAPVRTVINRHERALCILADRLVSQGTYMEGLGGAKCSRRT
jgi:DNA-directed RNA polymerase specialized sigma24 family protein